MKKFILIAVLALVGGMLQAQGVYDRYTGVSSAHGAATFTFSGDYAAFKITSITVKGAGITNLATASRITYGNAHTQTVSAAIAGTGVAQATITNPYLLSGDRVVFAPNTGNEAATTNFIYMIEGELQRR